MIAILVYAQEYNLAEVDQEVGNEFSTGFDKQDNDALNMIAYPNPAINVEVMLSLLLALTLIFSAYEGQFPTISLT